MEESLNDQGCCVKYKFAFQWCEGQEPPWWIVNSEGNTSNGMHMDTSAGYSREPIKEPKEGSIRLPSLTCLF